MVARVSKCCMVLLLLAGVFLSLASARKLLEDVNDNGDSTGLNIEHATAPGPVASGGASSIEDEKNFMAYGGIGHYSGIGGFVGVGGLPGVGGIGGGIGKVGGIGGIGGVGGGLGGLGGGIAKGGAIGGGVGGGIVHHR